MKLKKILNEVEGKFSKGEKMWIVDIINDNPSRPMKASLGNIQKFNLKYISDVIQKYIKDNKDESEQIHMLERILQKIHDIWNRENLIKQSSDGFFIVDSGSLKRDNSGPYATTGTSIDYYKIRTNKSEKELEKWLTKEGGKAKSSYMVSRKLLKIVGDPYNADFKRKEKITDYYVEIKTTVWYNQELS